MKTWTHRPTSVPKIGFVMTSRWWTKLLTPFMTSAKKSPHRFLSSFHHTLAQGRPINPAKDSQDGWCSGAKPDVTTDSETASEGQRRAATIHQGRDAEEPNTTKFVTVVTPEHVQLTWLIMRIHSNPRPYQHVLQKVHYVQDIGRQIRQVRRAMHGKLCQ